MFGSKETFSYALCTTCGCLQMERFPPDLSAYYPKGYYAQEEDKLPRLARYLIYRRDRYVLQHKGLLGRCLFMMVGNLMGSLALLSLVPLDISPDTRILDVGCGKGELLGTLRRLGFERLDGIDPYNDRDLGYDGLTIRKATLQELVGTWDLIMLHHVFEHLPNPTETLSHIYQRLRPGGHCLIRIPLVSSFAWEHYGVNWVQLDAPRHLFLHSLSSMTKMAEEAGFTVVDVVFDSTAFQFWGSELYLRDIPLNDAAKRFFSVFSLRQLLSFARRAKALNKAAKGDQAAFYLRKE